MEQAKHRIVEMEMRLRQKWRGLRAHREISYSGRRSHVFTNARRPEIRFMQKRINEQLEIDQARMDAMLQKSGVKYISCSEWCGLLNQARNGDLAGAIRQLEKFDSLDEFTWVTEARRNQTEGQRREAEERRQKAVNRMRNTTKRSKK